MGGLLPPPPQTGTHLESSAYDTRRHGRGAPGGLSTLALDDGFHAGTYEARRTARGVDGKPIEEMVAEPTQYERAMLASIAAEEEDPLASVYEGGVRGFLEDAEQAIEEVENVITEVADAVEDAVAEALGEHEIDEVTEERWQRQREGLGLRREYTR